MQTANWIRVVITLAASVAIVVVWITTGEVEVSLVRPSSLPAASW